MIIKQNNSAYWVRDSVSATSCNSENDLFTGQSNGESDGHVSWSLICKGQSLKSFYLILFLFTQN